MGEMSHTSARAVGTLQTLSSVLKICQVSVCVFECVRGPCVSLSKGIDSEAKSERERESTRNCDSGKVLS